jgi:hypothetical protein
MRRRDRIHLLYVLRHRSTSIVSWITTFSAQQGTQYFVPGQRAGLRTFSCSRANARSVQHHIPFTSTRELLHHRLRWHISSQLSKSVSFTAPVSQLVYCMGIVSKFQSYITDNVNRKDLVFFFKINSAFYQNTYCRHN